MCIIVAKNKGVAMPNKEILERCFDYNSDGAGYMFVKNGKVHINKGFMTFDSFYKSLEKLNKVHNLEEHAIVMHFRISTGGNVDGGNCHPYPITSNEKHLRRTQFITDLGMAHNGIISDYSHKSALFNDTQLFVRDCVSVIKSIKPDFLHDERVMNLLKDVAGSKLCFLDSDENIHFIGDFIKDKDVYYSNNTYLTYYSYPRRGSYTYLNGYGSWNGYYDEEQAGTSYSDYYKKKEEDKIEDLYLSENLVLEGYKDSLGKQKFDLLMQDLYVLDPGTVVELSNDKEYLISDSDANKFYVDNFWNLYYVDEDKYIIGLISESVSVY